MMKRFVFKFKTQHNLHGHPARSDLSETQTCRFSTQTNRLFAQRHKAGYDAGSVRRFRDAQVLDVRFGEVQKLLDANELAEALCE